VGDSECGNGDGYLPANSVKRPFDLSLPEVFAHGSYGELFLIVCSVFFLQAVLYSDRWRLVPRDLTAVRFSLFAVIADREYGLGKIEIGRGENPLVINFCGFHGPEKEFSRISGGISDARFCRTENGAVRQLFPFLRSER
jgi:hypothetical protein